MCGKAWAFGLVLAFVCAASSRGADPLALDVSGKANIPLGHSSELFSLGGAGEINGRFSLPFATFIFLDGSLRYDVNPSRAGRPLSLIGLGADVGLALDPVSWLAVKAYGGAGGYLGYYQDAMSGGPYFTIGTGFFFRLFPPVSLGLAASYVHFLEGTTALYQGISASLGVVVHLAAMLRQQDIEIQQIEINPIFPIFQKYYDNHPLGRLSIVNKGRDVITEVAVGFFVHNGYMDAAKTCATIPQLKPGEKATVDLYALLSDRVLGITEATKVPADIRVTYAQSGGKEETTHTETIRLYDRNAMTWDDDRKAAAFVTLKDPAVLRFSKQVAGMVREKSSGMVNQNLRIAMSLFEAMSLHGMKYVVDPKTPHTDSSRNDSTVDFLQFPRQSLDYRAGDCDDLSILYCALLESVGIDTAFITIPGHIYAAFSLGIRPEEAARSFTTTGDMIFLEDQAWVPVESTMMGEPFLRAWQTGAKEWRENVDGKTASLLPMNDSWKLYEPVGLPGEMREMQFPALADIETRYMSELVRFIDREVNPQAARLQEQVQQDGSNPRAPNALGVLYARYGLLDRAMEAFQESLSRARFAPALLNLANLYCLKKDLKRAFDCYSQAAQIEPDNPKVLLGMARVQFDLENFALARDYYARLQAASPEMAKKFSFLGSRDTEQARASSTSIREVMVWSEE
jgi:tetratricopeptide (TPR) repeat protein